MGKSSDHIATLSKKMKRNPANLSLNSRLKVDICFIALFFFTWSFFFNEYKSSWQTYCPRDVICSKEVKSLYIYISPKFSSF